MNHTATDVDVMARTIYGEARGEQFLGQIAVGWVIRNRTELGGWWGKTIVGVCKMPSQFSCWYDDQKERIEAVTLDDGRFRTAYAAAVMVMTDIAADPTHHSTHYYAHRTIPRPRWAENMTHTVTIGGHQFYVEEPK